MTSTRARYAGYRFPSEIIWSRLLSWRGLAREHRVELIAIGNGTASRETDRLDAELPAIRSLSGGKRTLSKPFSQLDL